MTLVALLIVAGCSAGEDPSTAAGITPATASAFASDGAVQYSGPGTVTGRLPVSAVAEVLPTTRPSPSPAGSARVTVTFEPDGFVTGVHIEGPEGSFTVGTTFSDFQPGPG